MLNDLPNIFILGAAKSGTTSLFNLLKQHYEVYFPFAKETAFFSNDDFYTKGLNWYWKTYYKNKSQYPIRGDASPYYLYWSKKVAPRIRLVYQEKAPRFILIFRNPMQRAYSFYWQVVRNQKEPLSFRDALDAEESRLEKNKERLYSTGSMTWGYFRGGLYAAQLEPFLELFPYRQFLFLLQEDLKDDFDNTIQKILTFLALDKKEKLKKMNSNISSLPRSSYINSWLRNKCGLKEMFKPILPFKFRHRLKRKIITLNLKPFTYPPMDLDIYNYLKYQYRDEIIKLENIINRDLSHWLD